MDSGEVAIVNYLRNKNIERKEKFTIFDVGANKGQFLELLLDNMSCDEFDIFCFEPIQAAYNDLQQKFCALEHAVFENYGLDHIVHEGEIYFDQPASLRSSKYQRDLRHLGILFSESERVKFTTLDQYCLNHEIDAIDLLKIDVEGNEFNVLKGSETMLTRNAIRLITFEFGRAQIDSDRYFKDYYYYLTDFGMKHLYRILPNGFLKSIKKYDESNEIFFTTNYLAVMK